MNLREAAQQALDELIAADGMPICNETDILDLSKTIDALRAALADTQDWDEVEALRASLREHMSEIHRLRAALEPVTECHEKEGDNLSPPLDHVPDAGKMVASVREDRTVEPVAYIHETGFLVRNPGATLTAGMKLYSAAPKRKPLTDEEIESCIDEHFEYGLDRGNISNKSVIRFARAVIAKITGGEE